ncbi:survival motor neuron interacting protein 1-domain-containing protein [Zopfochytrium polystomum]|nr:survival motor neuron interacting protein 1-domain-containing protein [Zopfochytrium polystomum]
MFASPRRTAPRDHDEDDGVGLRRFLPIDDYLMDGADDEDDDEDDADDGAAFDTPQPPEDSNGSRLSFPHQQTKQTASAPTSALDYIRRVRKEAAACPNVMVAAIAPPPPAPDSMAADVRAQFFGRFNHESESTLPWLLRPKREWVTATMEEFKRLRAVVEQLVAQSVRDGSNNRQWPRPNQPALWKTVLYGDTKDQVESGESLTAFPEDVVDRWPIAETFPLLPLVSQLDNNQTFYLLEKHILWLSQDYENGEKCLSPLQMEWIFALLCRVETPLFPEQTSILRAICRRCRKFRALLMKEDWAILTNAKKGPREDTSSGVPAEMEVVSDEDGEIADDSEIAGHSVLCFNTPEEAEANPQLMGLRLIIAIVASFFGQADLR